VPGPDRHRKPKGAGTRDDFLHRLYLDEQTAGEHHVGPHQVVVAKRVHVEVYQANLPVARQQRRQRQQAERRKGCPFADHAHPVLVAPVRDGEARVYEQGIHRAASPGERAACPVSSCA
jgi:hypothetical protein